MGKIHILVRGRIRPGKEGEFAAAASEGAAKVKANDPGTERWEFYLGPDGQEFTVFETYRDSNAMLAHMGNLGDTLNKLFAAGDATIEMFGTPSDQLMQVAGGMMKGVYPRMVGVED